MGSLITDESNVQTSKMTRKKNKTKNAYMQVLSTVNVDVCPMMHLGEKHISTRFLCISFANRILIAVVSLKVS